MGYFSNQDLEQREAREAAWEREMERSDREVHDRWYRDEPRHFDRPSDDSGETPGSNEDDAYGGPEGDEPDEPELFHRIEVTEAEQGGVWVYHMTNDNDDDGVPGAVEEWCEHWQDRGAAIRHVGKSRIGISGIRVEVLIDGVRV